MYERSKDKDKKGPGESFSLSAVSIATFPQVFAAPNSRNLGLCAFSAIIQSTRPEKSFKNSGFFVSLFVNFGEIYSDSFCVEGETRKGESGPEWQKPQRTTKKDFDLQERESGRKMCSRKMQKCCTGHTENTFQTNKQWRNEANPWRDRFLYFPLLLFCYEGGPPPPHVPRGKGERGGGGGGGVFPPIWSRSI